MALFTGDETSFLLTGGSVLQSLADGAESCRLGFLFDICEYFVELNDDEGWCPCVCLLLSFDDLNGFGKGC